MKTITSWVSLLFLSFFSVAPFAFASDEEYLFDTLERPAYRASWNAMFKGEKAVPSWLANYAKTYDGPTVAGKAINIDGVQYKVHFGFIRLTSTFACEDGRAAI